jgi:hypothetical protein
MTRNERLVRLASICVALLVAVVAISVVAHAVQVITTPNAAYAGYSLAPGASSSSITPIINTPVMILADQTGVTCKCDDVGSSLMTLVNSTVDGELVWNGFESNKGGLTEGFSAVAGTHIMYTDFGHLVDLEVTNATSFHVHNSSSTETYNGQVTLVW